MHRLRPLALLSLLVLVHAEAGHGEDPWQEADVVPVVEDVSMPADIDVAADGALWYVEAYEGTLWRVAGEGPEQVREVEVKAVGDERGLVGLALAHDHAETGAYYLYYTAPDEDEGTNRLVRVEGGQETVLATVPAAYEHNGGRIEVAPDGNLFVGTGENQERDPAQDPDSLLGKVLRLTPAGEPVEGNLKGLVYSLGHRNVYGLALDPDTGELWATENSGWRRDEINRIEAGGNYGYPECEGQGLNGVDTPCPRDKGYTFPVMTFYEDRTAAPTGAEFWKGGLYWGSLKEGSIHHLWQADDGTWQDRVAHEHGAAVLDLAVAPDGRLYYSALDGIWRVDVPGDEPPLQPRGEQEGEQEADRPVAAPGVAAFLVLLALAVRRGR